MGFRRWKKYAYKNSLKFFLKKKRNLSIVRRYWGIIQAEGTKMASMKFTRRTQWRLTHFVTWQQMEGVGLLVYHVISQSYNVHVLLSQIQTVSFLHSDIVIEQIRTWIKASPLHMQLTKIWLSHLTGDTESNG